MFSGVGGETSVRIPGYQANLENTAATAAGIRAGLDVQGKKDINVLGWAGDGGTIDIGLQALSGAMERGDHIIYCCVDNEAYMNTGIQASGSTPLGASTTTTPGGKPTFRKNMMEIVAAHRIPYAATCSIAHLEDLVKKVEKAKNCGGTAYLHILTPCPTGWGYEPDQTVNVCRLAVQTNAWPLFEVIKGTEYHLTQKVAKPVPVVDYLKAQHRFAKITPEQMTEFQATVDKEYALLVKRAQA
jgi:pyruvate/2-oxoacid:ferredoxin oxidoreductase beta subunit